MGKRSAYVFQNCYPMCFSEVHRLIIIDFHYSQRLRNLIRLTFAFFSVCPYMSIWTTTEVTIDLDIRWVA